METSFEAYQEAGAALVAAVQSPVVAASEDTLEAVVQDAVAKAIAEQLRDVVDNTRAARSSSP